MKRRLMFSSAIATIALGFAVVSTAHALSSTVTPCQQGIAKAGLKFATKKLKTIQKCKLKNLKTPNDCPDADLNSAISALTTKFEADLSGKCGTLTTSQLSTARPSGLGFPGKCVDPNPGDGFTYADLQSCMEESHENKIDGGNHTSPAVDSLVQVEFGTTTGPITDSALLKCQKTISKDGGKVFKAVLKAVQKCRLAIEAGKLTGVAELLCATSDPKTAATIGKAESKANADIVAKCSDSQVQALDVCNNPNAGTAADAASCIVSTHHIAADDQSAAAAGLAEFEFAEPPSCGDGIINVYNEECDGNDDAACPGLCGPPGNFGCLCLNKPRERIIEHASADLDNGWSGQSHDSGIVEGGGYVVNLFDCDSDNTCGDHSCTVGRSCTGGTHSVCFTDSDCGIFGPCRSDIIDVAPHCVLNPQVSCTTNAQCPGTGNFCVITPHGAPLPLSAGGISVCVVNTFTENVTGTRDLETGDGAVRIRQLSTTNLSFMTSEPCSVCGGFCFAADPNSGLRTLCSTDADCDDPALTVHKCITDPICSTGPNADHLCRPDPPFGGPTALFGNPSVDCPPKVNIIGQLDILFNPATSGTATMQPTVQCDDPSFMGKTCSGGTNNGATCTNASECPGGSCSFQCYCPNGGGQKQRPNSCDAACVGGPSDALPCTSDSNCVGGANDSAPCTSASECPGGTCGCTGGFCHLADCRPDSGAPALLQPNEGGCTVTSYGVCSTTVFKTCNSDFDCTQGQCPFCQPGETCVFSPKNCFINSGTTSSGIVRVGVPGPVDGISASVFCIAQTSSPSVNSTAGLPGPGALIQPETSVHTGIINCP